MTYLYIAYKYHAYGVGDKVWTLIFSLIVRTYHTRGDNDDYSTKDVWLFMKTTSLLYQQRDVGWDGPQFSSMKFMALFGKFCAELPYEWLTEIVAYLFNNFSLLWCFVGASWASKHPLWLVSSSCVRSLWRASSFSSHMTASSCHVTSSSGCHWLPHN